MALVLKKCFQGYFWIFNELNDKRADDYVLLRTPIPTMIILFLWYRFIFKWGPDYMKDRKPFNLKKIMIVYNIAQVIVNAYILSYVVIARNVINWQCGVVDYSNSYWGLKFLSIAHLYYLVKLADLIDTIFFVLRKKHGHISFLHVYHHFGMVILTWIAGKFIGGGHSYFVALANCPVHVVLYSYYLLTAYDSKYSKVLWLKKFITQMQLTQFAYLIYAYGKLLFIPDCKYPMIVVYLIIPQNLFLIALFGDFYVRTYYLEPKKRRKELEKKRQEAMENPKES